MISLMKLTVDMIIEGHLDCAGICVRIMGGIGAPEEG